ncbi:MAG: GGDEF domain-containing protein [Thermoanaerobaculia bacterium]|nr:GGDEF domain-containing protein [Thermoanaerobaculia bacterium]
MLEDSDFDIVEVLRRHDELAVNRLLAGMMLLALFGVPLSLSRAFLTGWQPAHWVHVASFVALLGLMVLRQRLSAAAKAWWILAITLSVTVIGMTTYGLLGNGLIWGLFSLFIAMSFFEARVVGFAVLVISLATGVSCYLFVFAGRRFPGDAGSYLGSLASWGTAVFGGAIFGALIVYVVSLRRRELGSLLILLKRKNREIAQVADHDDLTGLPVFRVFLRAVQSSIEQARREEREIATLFIDLDGFKEVNDAFGHATGDEVLSNVASEIVEAVRTSDVVSRMGGDEFVVLVNSAQPVDLEHLAQRLLESIGRVRRYGGQSIIVGASIGVAKFRGEGETAEELIGRADQAMYRAKNAGGNAFEISGPDT